MEIEHEVMGIEELLLEGKDKKLAIKIKIEDMGEFKAYVTPVSYGQGKKIERKSEQEIADYVLTNHFFKSNDETFTPKELEMLPVGVLKAVAEKIMDLSGFNISSENIESF